MTFKLNRNQLKYLVIVAMLIDHIAWAFVPTVSVLGFVMHFIGRLTGPTMAFFLVEGFEHTRDRKKYLMRLGIFALISWIPFSLFEVGRITYFFGVIYTLFLGLVALMVEERQDLAPWKKILLFFILLILSLFGDWGLYDIIWPVLLYRYRDNPKQKWFSFCLVGALYVWMVSYGSKPFYTGLWALGTFMVPVIISKFYSGEAGSRHPFHKWFFYVFYPAHLLILYLLKLYFLG